MKSIYFIILLTCLFILSCNSVRESAGVNRKVLDEMALMLIERETIDTEDIQDLLNRSEVKVANYI